MAESYLAAFYGWLAGKKTEKDLPGGGGNYIDVRDGTY
jgi:hypothetical protein